jgi:hypothetical protein
MIDLSPNGLRNQLGHNAKSEKYESAVLLHTCGFAR